MGKVASQLVRYGAAVVAVGAAALLKLAFYRFLSHEAPFLLFFGAVMAAGWYGGLGPGLAATALAVAAGMFFFRRPPLEFGFTREHELRMALFAVEGLFISGLSGVMHKARRRAERNAAIARDLEQTLSAVSEAEQRRIGHDLHDGLGQHLTGIALMSKALEHRLRHAGRPEAGDAGEIADIANASIDWTRDLARGLAPVDLDRFSLPAALRGLAHKTARIHKIACVYDGTDDLVLPDEITTLNLYRVAQEAVNNAVKHARPRNVRITLRESDDIILRVEDDGAGMHPADRANGRPSRSAADSNRGDEKSGGMGLRIMRYRANAVGAQFTIQSTLGSGTAVVCALPNPESSRFSERSSPSPAPAPAPAGSTDE